MTNPYSKGSPDIDFRDQQKSEFGISEDFNADARRYNQHNIEWINNKAQYEGGDGFYYRMRSGICKYKIYFNTDESSTETVVGQFPINGRTRREIVTLIQEAFDEVNKLKIGNPLLRFEYVGTGSGDDSNTKVADGDIFGYLDSDPPSLRGSILCNLQNKDGSVGGSAGTRANYFTIWLSVGDSFVKDNEKFKYTVKHELLHNLGCSHEYPAYSTEFRKENKDGIVYSFYNEQINFSKLAPRFRTLELDKDKISWLDVQYNTQRISDTNDVGWNWKIHGQMSNLPVNYNKEFAYESGYCDALLVNLTTMEYEFRTPIDYTGYFEFRLRLPSEQLANYGILVVSGEWDRKRLIEYNNNRYDKFEPKTFWNGATEDEKGYLYYFYDDKQISWCANQAKNYGRNINPNDPNGFSTIPSTDSNIWSFGWKAYNENSGVISLIYIHANQKVSSLQELENRTGVKNIYAYFINIDKKPTLSILKEKSMLKNKLNKYRKELNFRCAYFPKKNKKR